MGAVGSSCAPCKCDLPVNALKSLIAGTETLHRANEELLVWLGSNRYRFEDVENSTNNVGRVEDLIKCLESQWEAWSMLARMVRIPLSLNQTTLFADGREVMCVASRKSTTVENLLAWMYKLSNEQRIFAREMLKVQARLQNVIQDLKPSFSTDSPAADMQMIKWNAGYGLHVHPEYAREIHHTEKTLANLRGRQEQEQLEFEALHEREVIEEEKLDLIRQCQNEQRVRLDRKCQHHHDHGKNIKMPLMWPGPHNRARCGCNQQDKLAADELRCTIHKQQGDGLPDKHLSVQLGTSDDQDMGECSCQHGRAIPHDVTGGGQCSTWSRDWENKDVVTAACRCQHGRAILHDVTGGGQCSTWSRDWESKDVVTARPPHFPCCDNYPVPALREQ